MNYIFECPQRFSSWLTALTMTPTEGVQLNNKQRKTLDRVWSQVEACNCPLNKQEVASAISLMGRVKPGRYSKAEVFKMTNGVLKRTIVISKAEEVYIIPQKEGNLLGKGVYKHAYKGYQITSKGVKSIAYLTVKWGMSGDTIN